MKRYRIDACDHYVGVIEDDDGPFVSAEDVEGLIARAEVAEADVVRMTAEIAVLEEDLALEEKWGEAVLRRAERAEEQRDRARGELDSWRGYFETHGFSTRRMDASLSDDPPGVRDFDPLAPIESLPAAIREDIRTERGWRRDR